MWQIHVSVFRSYLQVLDNYQAATQKVTTNRILTSSVIFKKFHVNPKRKINLLKVVDWIKCHQIPSVVVISWGGGGQYELSKINLVLLITFFIILALTFAFEHNIHLHSCCCVWVLKMSQPFLFYRGVGNKGHNIHMSAAAHLLEHRWKVHMRAHLRPVEVSACQSLRNVSEHPGEVFFYSQAQFERDVCYNAPPVYIEHTAFRSYTLQKVDVWILFSLNSHLLSLWTTVSISDVPAYCYGPFMGAQGRIQSLFSLYNVFVSTISVSDICYIYTVFSVGFGFHLHLNINSVS